MLKKIIACLALTLVICVLFSGCNLKILSTEELIRPPKSNGVSSFLQQDFEKTVDSTSAQMKTPINGEYRSSYVIYDIDSDGIDEALVFYSDYSLNGLAHVAVFKNDGHNWTNIAILNGLAEEIYDVSFNDVTGDGKKELLISWTSLNPESTANETLTLVGNRILTIYTFNGTALTLQKTEHYTKMFVSDFNKDGSDDIFLSTVNIANESNKTMGRIIRFDSNCSVKFDKSFALIGMLDVLSITSDTISQNNEKVTRIYVDGNLSDAAYVTDVVEFFCANDKVNLPIQSNSAETPITARTSNTYAQDINNDGIVEIPTLQELPYGKRINSEEEDPTPLNLVVWSTLDEDGLTVKFKCLYNKSQNYYFEFDEEWIGNITAVYNVNNALLVFYSVNEDGDLTDKLFSIRAFSSSAWNENEFGFSLLVDADAYVYGYTAEKTDLISKQKIKDSFVVMT